jgi:hypothetical protein
VQLFLSFTLFFSSFPLFAPTLQHKKEKRKRKKNPVVQVMGENSDTNTQKLNTWMPVGRGSTDIVTAQNGTPQQQQRVAPQKPATISFPQKKPNKVNRPPRPTNRPINRPINRPHKPCKPQPPSLKPQAPSVLTKPKPPCPKPPKPLKAGHPVHVRNVPGMSGASVARQTPQIPAPKPVQHAQEDETEDASTSFASHFDPKSLCSACF